MSVASKHRLNATLLLLALSSEVGARMIGELPLMSTSLTEPAGASTVTVSIEGAVQAMAEQLHVAGSIVTEMSCEMPALVPQDANVVLMVSVLLT